MTEPKKLKLFLYHSIETLRSARSRLKEASDKRRETAATLVRFTLLTTHYLGTTVDDFAPSLLQVEDVKKEISGFMQSQSVAQEVAESDADMVQHYSISSIGWQTGTLFI